PAAERRHLRARAAADDEFEAGVDLPHGPGGLGGQARVLLRAAVPQLPGAVHLVAQAPHADVVRAWCAVGDPQVRESCAGADVGVFQDVQGVLHAARPEIHRVHELAADLARPRGELVEPDLVRLGGVPGQIEASWPLLTRADAVLPAVSGDEVPARIADGRHAELPDQRHDVFAVPLIIGGGMAGFVDAVVHTAAQMLDERAEETAVDRADGEIRVDCQVSADHGPLLGRLAARTRARSTSSPRWTGLRANDAAS